MTKAPADHGVVSAGGGKGAPTFVSDPGVLAGNQGLHLFFSSNIFCAKAGAWYFSWDPAEAPKRLQHHHNHTSEHSSCYSLGQPYARMCRGHEDACAVVLLILFVFLMIVTTLPLLSLSSN